MTDDSSTAGEAGGGDARAGAGGAGAAPGPSGAHRAGSPAGDPPVTMRRDTEHKLIAGVCAGLGRYFGLDPVIFRVVLAALTLSGGLGLLLYSLGWLLMPVGEDGRSELHRMLQRRFDSSSGQALLSVVIAASVFLSFFGDGPGFFPWLLMAMLIGAVAWAGKHRPRGAPAPAPDGEEVAGEPAAPVPPGGPSWWQRNDPLSKEYAKEYATAGGPAAGAATAAPYRWGPEGAGEREEAGGREERATAAAAGAAAEPEPGAGAGAAGPWDTPPAPHPHGERPYQRERSLLGKSVTSVAVIAGTVTGLLVAEHTDRALQGTEVGLAVAVGVIGLGLLLSAWCGRARAGAVVLASLLTLCLAGVAALPKSMDSSWGQRHWVPVSASAVAPSYRLGAGSGELNLAAVDPHGGTVATRAEIGAGQLTVQVPRDVRVRVSAEAGLGSVRLPGPAQHDIRIAENNRESAVLGARYAARGTLDLRLKAGIGDVVVHREAA